MKKLSLLVTFLAFTFTSGSALAVSKWTLGEVKNSGCFDGSTRMGGAKYCHNCGNQGGNRVVWTFHAKCNGKVEATTVGQLKCGGSVAEEGTQLRSIKANATSRLPKKGCAVHAKGTKNKTGTKKKE